MPAPTTLRKGPILAIVLASYTMIVLDISIVITALPKIHASLGFSATSLSWVQNAYLLAFGGLLLLGARAGDLLGRRKVFILGLGLFTIASAAVGAAQSEAWLIAARAVQGAGAGAEEQQAAEGEQVGVLHPGQRDRREAQRRVDLRQRGDDDRDVEHDHQVAGEDDRQDERGAAGGGGAAEP